MDFFDPEELANQVESLLKDKQRREILGKNAREFIIRHEYDLKSCLKRQVDLVDRVMA